MPDVWRSILDVVGLEVTDRGAIEADLAARWRVALPQHDGSVWVATCNGPVYVDSGDLGVRLERGEVAIVRASQPVSVATDPDATEAPVNDPDDPVFRLIGVRPSSGVVHGTATFGPLADEVIALPDVHVARYWTGVTDHTIPMLQLLTDQRVAVDGPVASAIARALVATALGTWAPPFHRDASIRGAIVHILGSPTPPRVADLPRPPRCSTATLTRRFRETTGLAPDGFARWWTSIRARSLLDAGLPITEVAAEVGYADVNGLRRLLRAERSVRTEAPAVPLN
jgi:AraC-like DNA-binding protein